MITTWDAANSVRMPALLFFIRFVASKAMQEQHLSDFDFELPPELIAQYPLADRAASRLLHITEEVIEDCTFRDIEKFLRPGDLLIANNTRVIKARLLGAKATGGAVEALIERVTGEFTAIAMVRARARSRARNSSLAPPALTSKLKSRSRVGPVNFLS